MDLAESCSFMPPTSHIQDILSKHPKKDASIAAIIEAIAEGIADISPLPIQLDSCVDVPTTTITTTTTSMPVLKESGQNSTKQEEEEDDTDEPVLLNKIRYEPTEQYDANGRPVEFPFPPEFLPPAPVLSNGEPWQNDIVPEEEFNAVMETMALPVLPEDYRALATPHVPKQLVEASGAYVLYRASHKQGGDLGEARRLQATLSKPAKAFFAQFGIYAEDKNGRLVNWQTVFYVTHLLRTIPSEEAYDIEEDLFSGSQGISEYSLANWHCRKEHAIRLVVVSYLTGDNVEAIRTLDMLMRFRRSMVSQSMSITFHDLGKDIKRNQSLCFVCYLIENDGFRASWVSIGLNKGIAAKIPAKPCQPFYDGPYCNTCGKHHTRLLYCTTCYSKQYCNLSCLKKDRQLHAEFCKANAVK